ncbi:hypothetical protein, partial [Aeromonas sanarellii]
LFGDYQFTRSLSVNLPFPTLPRRTFLFARDPVRIRPIEWIPMRDLPHNFRSFFLRKCYPAHTLAETV